jgi:hypothetical protein
MYNKGASQPEIVQTQQRCHGPKPKTAADALGYHIEIKIAAAKANKAPRRRWNFGLGSSDA